MNRSIDIGGEVLARRTKPGGEKWNVAIEIPAKNASDEPGIQAIIALEDMAISTSGSYRKYYEENGIRYSHTIDLIFVFFARILSEVPATNI